MPQWKQLELLDVVEYVPAAQLVHTDADVMEYFPAAHTPVVEDRPVVAQYDPLGHTIHALDPVAD